VKSFVPNVSDFPDEPVVVAGVLDAGVLDELELELLLLPQAATSSAARIASAPTASVRVNRRESRADTRLGDGPRMLVFLLDG
jgi:hypothetical protein